MQFNVHALDTQQQVVALSLEAASEAAARDIAQSRGLSVFSVEGKRQAFALPRLTRSGGFKPALFSIELLALLEAGLNPVEAVQTLPAKEAAREPGQVLGGALAAIHRRGPLPRGGAAFPQLLLAFGSFVGKHGFFLFSAFILGVGSSAWALSRPQVRSALNQRLWRLPAIGDRMKTYQLARLYRTAGMLMRAGIPAVRALEMVEDLLAAHLRPQLRQARALIEQGHAMSAALGSAGLATPVATRMMLVGERSGDMGQMLGQIARFHDEEVARFVDWFTRAFEPGLMAGLGVGSGLVVVVLCI